MRKIKQNYSGNILFTVICIMSIITILLMSSIIIIASSNKKAVNHFAENQAYTTGKSIVDTYIGCLLDVSTDKFDYMKLEIKNISNPGELQVQVTLPSDFKGSLPKDASGKPYITVSRKNVTDFSIIAEIDYMGNKKKIVKKFKLNPPQKIYSDINTGKATNLNYRITSYNVCYTKLLRMFLQTKSIFKKQ